MVRCVNCGGKLPRECTCNLTPEEKLNQYLAQVKRTIELINAVRKGFTPKMFVTGLMKDGNESFIVQVKPDVIMVDDYTLVLKASLDAPRKFDRLRVTLFDVNDKLLFPYIMDYVEDRCRRKKVKIKVHLELTF